MATLECAAQVEPGRQDDVENGLRRDRAKHQPETRHVRIWGQKLDELMEGHQQKAEADEHAPEVARASRSTPEHQNTDQDQGGRHFCDVEGQHLDDEGRSDIGAEHDGERRHQIDQPAGREARHHQPGRGAALQKRCHPEAGEECFELVAQGMAEEGAQLGAEGPLHSGLNHVDAPQKERHRSGKINECERKIQRHGSLPVDGP